MNRKKALVCLAILICVLVIIALTICCKSSSAKPIADAGKDIYVSYDETNVTLNGSNSYDTDGCDLTYLWSRTEEGCVVETHTEMNPTLFVKIITGSYEYKLEVTNKCGISNTDFITIHKNSPKRFKQDPNAPKEDKCKDKEVCDPNSECYDPNNPDFWWMCDSNTNCGEKLECDPTKKCYDPNSPIHWQCFYEDYPECDPNVMVCTMDDYCFNPDYPLLYETCYIDQVSVIDLLSFTVTGNGNSVVLNWKTAQEVDNMGFYIYKSYDRGGPYERISKLIPASSMGVMGASYSFTDNYIVDGSLCFYKLEDVEIGGKLTQHEPVCVDWDGDGEGDCDPCECGFFDPVPDTEEDECKTEIVVQTNSHIHTDPDFLPPSEERDYKIESGCFLNLFKIKEM